MSVLGLASHQKTQGRIKLGESYVGPASMLLGLWKPPALVNRDLPHRRDVDGARAPIISIASSSSWLSTSPAAAIANADRTGFSTGWAFVSSGQIIASAYTPCRGAPTTSTISPLAMLSAWLGKLF